jgi:hypothetical protein
MSLESYGGMILTEQVPRTRTKACPSATLSTTNPTCTDQGANAVFRGKRPATNRLSHSTAKVHISNEAACEVKYRIYFNLKKCFKI